MNTDQNPTLTARDWPCRGCMSLVAPHADDFGCRWCDGCWDRERTVPAETFPRRRRISDTEEIPRVRVTDAGPTPRDHHGNLMTHLAIIAAGLLIAAGVVAFYLATNR